MATPTTTAIFTMPNWLVDVLKVADVAIQGAETLAGVKGSSGASTGSGIGSSGGSVSVLSEIGKLVPKLPTDPITAGIDAGAEALQVTSQILAAEDSPQMQAGRLNVAVQAALDKIASDNANAQKTGDASQVDKDLTP